MDFTSINFTRRSEDAFYDTVDLADFIDKDAEIIFEYLKSKIRLIPFSDYLKRYIYIKSGMSEDFKSINIQDYQHIIIDSFADNYTPKSFTETSAKISALTKNWLTQASVNRSTVFLLGYGLNMKVDDVSDFLTKALRERDFDFKNPAEVIHWYCFKNGYKYPKSVALKRQYDESPASEIEHSDNTMGARNTIQGIKDDDTLLQYLAKFKSDNHNKRISATVYRQFLQLYEKSRIVIAKLYSNDLYKDKTWTAADITESDVEKIICNGIPFNSSGNLEKMSASRLAKHFSNKRFRRQHISELLSQKTAIDRFDLITLNFFLFSQDEEYNNKKRYIVFANDTNSILEECMMGELYVTNPYECFLLMCILSDSPLATYAEVWEKSFE